MSQTNLFSVPPRDGAIGLVDAWAAKQTDDLVMGIDEAGRGPLAGPVVAAAVILPKLPLPPALAQLNDSKALPEAKRRTLARGISQHAYAVGVGVVGEEEIDRINILEATRKAMHSAVEMAALPLDETVGILLVDGHLPLPGYVGTQWPLVKGDARSWSIAAASIVAKVVRDRLMVVYDRKYPAYGFAKHKGYGTAEHRRALSLQGPSPIHRRSFKWRPVDD